MKQVAGRLKLELAQFRELAAFAQFGASDLDKATRAQLERGQRITEILKQTQYSPYPLDKEVAILYSAVNGYMDDVPLAKLPAFEHDFFRLLDTAHPEIGKALNAQKIISPEIEAKLKAALEEFKKSFSV